MRFFVGRENKRECSTIGWPPGPCRRTFCAGLPVVSIMIADSFIAHQLEIDGIPAQPKYDLALALISQRYGLAGVHRGITGRPWR